MKLVFFDFEVFKYLWLVVFIEHETNEKKVIINNSVELKKFYNENMNSIFCGYNSRQYDQFILKAILKDMEPYKVSNQLINEDKKGYQIVRKAELFPLNNFDVSTGFHSLKQLEAFMGSKIKESDVPFDLDRKLTEEEIQEVVEYCTHDVEETIKVFDNRKEEFDSQLSLLKAFDLSMTMFNKTKAQLSAYVLGAIRGESRDDEFDISIPDTLRISDKYKYIVDWYKNDDNKKYNKELHAEVAGIPHTFAWGGIHGSNDNYMGEGIILCCDVASLYPSIIIEYGYMSRNVTEQEKYREIRDLRLKLKAEKNPMHVPLKIVVNATYGAMKDQYNPLYDPLMANNICVAGQLLLLDLIEKIEPYGELIQSNTDGLFIKIDNLDKIEKIKSVAKEWEKRTRLDLEWDIYNKIYQKDVNNYIIINDKGEYKSKGAYVKKLSNIDYDLPIVNKALINYFVKNKPIEDTINECNELRDFQKVVKISRLYKYALHGEEKIKEKVLRVFASKDENAKGVFKVKGEDKIEKLANTPDKCFIYNESVIGIKVPNSLDKQYYLDTAQKRLNDFLDSRPLKKSKIMSSDIKFVNADIKDNIIELCLENYNDFIDLLVYITDNSLANTKQVEIFIKLNYFKQFGGNEKLLTVYREFKDGKLKYSKAHKEKTRLQRLEYLKEFEKQTEDKILSIKEQIEFENEYLGKMVSIYPVPRGQGYVINIDETYPDPKIKLYGIATGNMVEIKMKKDVYKKNGFKKGDFIQIIKHRTTLKSKYIWADEIKIMNY